MILITILLCQLNTKFNNEAVKHDKYVLLM